MRGIEDRFAANQAVASALAQVDIWRTAGEATPHELLRAMGQPASYLDASWSRVTSVAIRAALAMHREGV